MNFVFYLIQNIFIYKYVQAHTARLNKAINNVLNFTSLMQQI